MIAIIKQLSSHIISHIIILTASTEFLLRGLQCTPPAPTVFLCARLLEIGGRMVGAQAGSDNRLMVLSFHGMNVRSHADPRLCLWEIKF